MQDTQLDRPLVRTTPASGVRGWSRTFHIAQDVLLIAVFSVFAYLHGTQVFVDHIYTSVPLVLINTVYAFVFLTRRRSVLTTSRWQDWLVAALGGFLMFAFRPQDQDMGVVVGLGVGIQTAGLLFACICVASLGRSFGIVAANRGLKTSGAYVVVRHPIYAAHLLTDVGFLMANPSAFNFAVCGVIATAQVLRIRAEERILEASSDYAAYKQVVRYRLIPGLY